MATKAFLEQAYLAYFGRPIDPNGVAAFANSTETEVENTFWASPESQALYGSSFGLQQINMVYNMLFGRDAEPAGQAYWANQIAIGNLTPAGAAIGILRGALNDDVIAVNNKLAASAAFTAGLDTPEEILGYAGDDAAAVARDFLASITMTPATQDQVDTAIVAAVEAGTIGKTFSLTNGVDNLTGTPLNDTFNGFVGDDNNGNDISTVQPWDTINGGNGNDTLNLLLNYDYTIDPTMVNVEAISARFADSTDAHIDFANITGVNTIEIRDTNSDWGRVWGYNISEEIANYKFTNVARQKDSATMYMEFNNDVFTGDADEINVVLDKAGNTENNYWAGLEIYNGNYKAIVEVINVESMGSDNQFWYWDDYGASMLNTVNVTGDAALNLWIYSQEMLTTLDAASFDAGLTFAGRSAKDMTITTGAGKDVIDVTWSTQKNTIRTGAGDDTVRTGDNLAAGDLLDGGAGIDTLGMSSAIAVAGSALSGTASTDFQALFSDFEAISLMDYLTGNVDMAKLDGINYLVLAGNGGTTTIAGLTTGATIENTASDSWWTTVNMTAAATGAADVLNLKQTSAGSIKNGISAAGVETINVVLIDTDSSAHQNQLGLDVADATSVTVSGNAGVNIFGLGYNTKLTTFDASGISGAAADAAALAVFFGSGIATATATVTIKGGSGNDVLSGNAAMDDITGGAGADNLYGWWGNDTISGDAGNDTIIGGAGLDTLSGGTGVDTFRYMASAESQGTTADVITDFTGGVGGDILRFDGDPMGLLNASYVGTAYGYGSVLSSLSNVKSNAVLDSTTNILYLDVNHDGQLGNADMAIQLIGVSGLTNTDNFIWV